MADETPGPPHLPPYSGDCSCPKCKAEMGTTWHSSAGKLNVGFPCYRESPWSIFGHLCRRCTRCGYGWIEATADATADTPGLRSLPGGAG